MKYQKAVVFAVGSMTLQESLPEPEATTSHLVAHLVCAIRGNEVQTGQIVYLGPTVCV